MKQYIDNIKSFELIKNDDWFDYDLKITLKPSFKCNHKCWFCGEYDNNTKTWTKDQCDEVLSKLKEIPKNKKKIFFYFYGGEPTLSRFWEYLNYEIVKLFPDKELFLQTHTNLSLPVKRLEKFLIKIHKLKSSHHTVDICNSYHIGKQKVIDYIKKMDICEKYNSLGFCFFSTEIPKKEQMLDEMGQIIESHPTKLKMKFTEIENLTLNPSSGYDEYIKDADLIGDDNGKSLEYRYWMKYYPQFQKYFEESWNFLINNKLKLNYSHVKGNNIHKKFRFMKCESGKKNIIINYDMRVFRCNDYSYKNLKSINLSDLKFEQYLDKCERCVISSCCDGLDHKKTL